MSTATMFRPKERYRRFSSTVQGRNMRQTGCQRTLEWRRPLRRLRGNKSVIWDPTWSHTFHHFVMGGKKVSVSLRKKKRSVVCGYTMGMSVQKIKNCYEYSEKPRFTGGKSLFPRIFGFWTKSFFFSFQQCVLFKDFFFRKWFSRLLLTQKKKKKYEHFSTNIYFFLGNTVSAVLFW